MSTTIDSKVVEMRFDNQRFEKGVSETLKSIEKLEKSLDLKGASKGLENVESAANKCNFSGMSDGLDSVKMKFSALEVAGMTVISNLTNSAINFGKHIVSSLTIDPVKMGFNEYELKMGSIQTIMAGTGESLETVNRYLNELNEYSDKTIYSFQDMTQNIGKFTNAGVSLEDSVAAIQGVSNVAAVSGANAGEASRAMYNFSQALSAGYVKLIDWKSIENANMATVEFKQQLIDSAVAAGTLTKTADGMYKTVDGKVISATKNFNDSLQDQWMTSEVLIGTLKKYTDESTEIGKKATQAATEVKTLSQLYDTLKESAQSGWAQTWEIIVGDFEEAKEFLSELNELVGGWIGSQAEARNDMLENWKVLGGRTALLETFRNMLEGIGSIVKPIGQAFREIFPPMTAERLLGFTEGLRNLAARLKVSDDTADKIKRTFKGLFALLDIGRMAFVAVMNAVGRLLNPMGTLGGGVLSVTAGIGDLLVGIRNFVKESNILEGIFGLLASAIGFVLKITGSAAKVIGDAFSEGPIRTIVEFLNNLKISVSDTFTEMGDAIEGSTFFKIFDVISETLTKVAGVVTSVLGKAFKGLSNAFDEGGIVGVLDLLINGAIGVGLIKLIKAISDFLDKASPIRDALADIMNTVDEVFGALEKTFKSFTNAVNAAALKTFAGAILTLVIALFALTLIDKEKLMDALSVLTVLVIELGAVMKLMSGFKANRLASSAQGIAMALLLMIIPLKILAGMEWEEMGRGLAGLTAMIILLAGSLKILSKVKTTGVLKNITLLKSIIWALILMTIPLVIIGNMEWEEIGKGLSGMAGMLVSLMAVLKILSKIKTNGVLKNITIIQSITTALILMTIPLVVIGFMSWESIAKGLVGMAGMLINLTVVLAFLSKVNTNGVLKNVVMIRTIATTLILMTVPLVVIGFMSWESIAKGLVGMSGMLLILTTVLALLSKVNTSGVLKNVTMITTISWALILMTIPMLAIGSMKWESVAKGLTGLAGMLAAMLITLAILSKIKMTGVIKSVTTLTTISAALILMTIPLIALGMMSWDDMLQGLAGLGIMLAGMLTTLALLTLISKMGGAGGVGILFAIAGAIAALVPSLVLLSMIPAAALAKSLIAIAGAIVILGVAGALLKGVTPYIMIIATALFTVGAGFLAAGVGVTLFGIGLGILATTIVAFGASIVSLISTLELVTSGIAAIVAALIKGVIKGVGEGLIELIKIITAAMPEIAKLMIALVEMLCDVLVECVPKIVNTVLILVSEILKALASFIPDIVKSLGELLVGLIGGLAEIIGPIIDKIVDLIVEIIEGIARGAEPIIAAILDLLIALINGAIKGIAGMDLASLDMALANVAKLTAIIALLSTIPLLMPGAMVGVTGLAAIVGKLSIVLAAFGALSRIPGLQDLIDDGGGFLQSVGNAIGNFIGGIIGGVGEGVSASLPIIGTNLSLFMSSIQGFVTGASSITEDAVNGIKNLASMILMLSGTAILESIASFISGGSSIGKFASDLVILGAGLAGFSAVCSGVSFESVKAGTDAAMALAEMANTIPNEGGIKAWFAGDNSMSKWASQLPILGAGLFGFAVAVAGINTVQVTAAALAAQAIANMCSVIPNEGGIKSWFAGDNSMSKWASQLPILGAGLLQFSISVTGIKAENVRAAASAAKSIAEMASVIPNEGGIKAWFAGDNSMARWASQLPILGLGLFAFSTAVTGINTANIEAAASAAKSLADMTSVIPTEGGVKAWFVGESAIAKYGQELCALGLGISLFSASVTGTNTETVKAAAAAGKSIVDMTSAIPNEGGIKAWFAGETSISKFAGELPGLGSGIKGFSDAVNGVVPENVTAAANAAKALAEMTATIPKSEGIAAWFTGETDVETWAGKLPTLGKGLKGFSDSVVGIVPENVTAAASAAKSLAEMTETVPKNTDKIIDFGDNLSTFGGKLSAYFKATSSISAEAVAATDGIVDAVNKVASINASGTESAAKAITNLTKAIKDAEGISGDSTSGFVTAVKKLATVSADAFVKSFEDVTKKMKEVGKAAIEAFVKGVSDNTKTAKTAGTDLAEACAEAAGKSTGSFSTAGKNLVEGFASGISENTYMAEAKAKAMAEAAAKAAREALDINSPSKVFRAIGTSIPEGLAQGVDRFGYVVDDSIAGMSSSAVRGFKDSIARIADAVNSDMDSEPVIRPVLDLSSVESGMHRLGRMVNIGSSVGLMANVGAINSGMSRYGQNGDETTNNGSNVTNNTYIVEGVTYDDGSNIASAVEELVHAARVERRT